MKVTVVSLLDDKSRGGAGAINKVKVVALLQVNEGGVVGVRM
jgi:hypothetical protein